jgi:hypothetical protein
MIRYSASTEDIRDKIRASVPGWFDRAQVRTEKSIKDEKFADRAPIWSEVKPVFMELQFDKCIYCERQLEGPEFGTIEHDLEHFRPKSAVKVWPKKGDEFDYPFPTGGALSAGYYWLAHEVRNYAASCKTCNSPLKGAYFPILGTRKSRPGPFSELAEERPLLCYPIGETDSDPESLVTFVGIMAIPAAKSGDNYRRGRVIIDFHRLNREHLRRERAKMLLLLGDALLRLEAQDDLRDRRLVAKLQEPNVPHAACSRAFSRLWDSDKSAAKQIVVACKDYLISADVARLRQTGM